MSNSYFRGLSQIADLALTPGALTAAKLILVATLLASPATAQVAIDWYSVDGGGGVSSGGTENNQLFGVVGQIDTAGMSGGNLSLSGGYLPLPPDAETLFKSGFE